MFGVTFGTEKCGASEDEAADGLLEAAGVVSAGAEGAFAGLFLLISEASTSI